MSNNPNMYSPSQPYQPPKPKSNTGIIILIVAAVMAVPMMLACLGIMVALLLPAVQAAREAARRMACSNNEKQIVLALLNYEAAYGAFPPAYTVDAQGNRLHSWRTLILPFIEQQTIYAQIDLNKPWDDPVNLPFSQITIPTYQCPSAVVAANLSTYVVVVDPDGIFSGVTPTRLDEVSDGLSRTLLITEVAADQAVPWMSPNDINLSEFINPPTRGSHHPGGRNIGRADGSVMFFESTASAETMSAMVNMRDGN
jgi:prepilin-type processing-associated H-X9-DG protein